MRKNIEDLNASILILRGLIASYNSGIKEMYRPISVELRKLLCEKKPLLSRVINDCRLHKLYRTYLFEKTPSLKQGHTYGMPGSISSNGKFQLSFAPDKSKLPLDEWIRQPFFNEKMTVYEVIKSVADKEGAHPDENYNEVLELGYFVRYFSTPSHFQCIVGIASYLIDWWDIEKPWVGTDLEK